MLQSLIRRYHQSILRRSNPLRQTELDLRRVSYVSRTDGSDASLDALDNLPKTADYEKFIAAVRPALRKYKGIGVRIEDDMVVTDDGVKWMTGSRARSIPDIEAFIAKARR